MVTNETQCGVYVLETPQPQRAGTHGDEQTPFYHPCGRCRRDDEGGTVFHGFLGDEDGDVMVLTYDNGESYLALYCESCFADVLSDLENANEH